MADGDLIGWLLDLDVLVAHKFRLFHLKNQLAFNLVFDALCTWAFHLWSELLLVDDLVDLEATGIASIYCYLHAGLDVTASGDYTFYSDEPANGT